VLGWGVGVRAHWGHRQQRGGWYGSSVVRVAKDEDRWLVVSHDDSSVALLGYAIPIYMTGVTWSRFKPLTDGPAPEN